jgi:hypothetical protein
VGGLDVCDARLLAHADLLCQREPLRLADAKDAAEREVELLGVRQQRLGDYERHRG